MFDIGGAAAVKHHPFFEDIQWMRLIALQVEPPLQPDLLSITDTSNFCEEFVQMAVPRSLSQDSVENRGSVTPRSEDEAPRMYRGFSYVAEGFVDNENWKFDETDEPAEGSNMSLEQEVRPGVTETALRDKSPVEIRRTKKVKGKRVRNKKGKRAPVSQGIPVTNAIVDAQELESIPTTSSGLSALGSQDPSFSTPGSQPTSFLSDETKGLSHERGSHMEIGRKASGLEAMLAKQQEMQHSSSAPRDSDTRRINVWSARELPAPAPVPTPGIGHREHGASLMRNNASTSGRSSAPDTVPLPGRRLEDGKFVWKRPV